MNSFLRSLPSRFILCLLPLFVMLFVEWASRRNSVELGKWLLHQPLSALLSYLITAALYVLLTALTGRSRLSFWLLCALLLPLGAISGSKLRAIGSPYYPWDFVFHNELVEYKLFLSRYFTWPMAAAFAGFLLASCLILHIVLRRRPLRLSWQERSVYAIIALLLLSSILTEKPIPFKNMYQIDTVPWDHTLTYEDNGFLLSTTMLLHFLDVDKPDGYNRASIEAAIGHNAPNNQGQTGSDGRKVEVSETNPNIIVMLSESFWDPTVMTNVSFSRDPIPFLHSLQRTHTSGWMLSPQFGGSTANVEFEVLSGNSMRFLPDNTLPYIEYMNHGVDSLASILTRQGYTATSINPFFNWFFDSRKVYKHFGFARFISSEFFPNDFSGPNYADRAVVQKIIEETETSAGPDFIFANTMENHHPYAPGKFSENTIQVQGDISAESKGLLETYAQGIANNDKALESLVTYFTRKKEPTVLLFFGDHLPFLEEDYKVYRDAGYVVGDDPELLTKVHNTPFVIWNNYQPLDGEKQNLHVSPAFLGPLVLEKAGKEGSYYTDFLYRLYQKFPVIPPKSSWSEYGIQPEELRDYERLQYDILFGKRYGYRQTGIKDTIVNPGYELGYGDPAIVSAVLRDNEVELEGERFFPSCKIVLDGIELDTSFNGYTKLYGKLPEGWSLDTGSRPHLVQVLIYDDKQMLLGASNTYLLNGK